MSTNSYKRVGRDGITVFLLNGKRLLILKRRRFPFTTNSGLWYFVAGGRKKSESYLQTAYREILEETGIKREDLKLLKKANIIISDRRKREIWSNRLFIFRSRKRSIRMNFEHNAYKWVTQNEFEKYRETIDAISKNKNLLKIIKLSASKR